jgi:hypothetical protein
MDNFSSGAVGLVLASNLYGEDDYYRSYRRFLKVATASRAAKPARKTRSK